MQIKTITVGYMGVNCYLLVDETEKVGAIIDPGCADEELVRTITEEFSGVNFSSIFLTHGHFDHIDGVKAIQELTGAKVLIHSGDGEMLGDNRKNLADIFGCPCTNCTYDRLLGAEEISLGGQKIQVLPTPGHSPGSVCYLWEGVMFSGDTLFANSIGRTDMPGASVQEMIESLRRLKNLPQDYIVYPGHGEATTLAREKAHNPWLAQV